ncbi:MAG: ATP-dependent RNA helicase HrpA, partial [Actinomycetota bacterium]
MTVAGDLGQENAVGHEPDPGRGADRLIGHTQPRRIAARAIAERVAAELDTTLGETVGYTVRFNDRVGPSTRVRLMTDGILLAEIPRDRQLDRYDTIIIDEAHERSLNIDFILGYLKQLLPRRPDLKVIITSATIDTERFASHFDDAPVIEVSGRTYPVDVLYRPIDGSDGRDAVDQNDGIVDAVRHLWRTEDGDVLVFCSGEREIRDAAEAVAELKLPGAEILPLYARLSAAEQHRVFAPHDRRRVVIATNVAETSVTVPGIRSVVDVGTARISRYSLRTKVQRLPIEPISQASADQRAGRCGRVAPGTCIRLYTEDDYHARPEFTEPEIQRTNLASVILQMASLGLGRVEAFPFVDPPEHRSIRDGIELLTELDALDPANEGTRSWLTPIGRELAKLPVDPRYGRMLVEADENGCLDEVMVIVAGLSVQDPRERPSDNQQRADESHLRFADPASDFLSYLNLWDYLATARADRSRNQFRRLCRREFLNYHRVIEWQDIHTQLRQVTRELRFRSRSGRGDRKGGPGPGRRGRRRDGNRSTHLPQRADAVDGPERWGGRERRDEIHRAILSGLLSHIGVKQAKDTRKAADRSGGKGRRGRQRAEFLGARNSRFAIAPGSALVRNAPEWVMAAELVETSRLWGRVAAGIEPEWVERLGEHLASYSYGEPWWDSNRGSASVAEQVTLYGLTVVANRTRQLSTIDRALARDLFIHHALVEGEWRGDYPFVTHNRELLEQVQAMEARSRRRDLLVEAKAIHDFYDVRLPDHICGTTHFRRWWKKQDPDQRRALEMTTTDLVSPEADAIDEEAFPDSWIDGDLDLELSYEFDPSSPLDGVSVLVPVEVLNQLDPDAYTWSVPGFRAELLSALVRSLPKHHRRLFAPITETIDELVPTLDPHEGPLLEVLAHRLGRQAGVVIDPTEFDPDRVPGHLRPTFRVINAGYELLAEGKDLAHLRTVLGQQVRATLSQLAAADNDWERAGLTNWDFGTLPRLVDTGQVKAYPSLVDEGDSAAIRLHPDEGEQLDAHWPGCRRLLRLNVAAPVRQLDRLLDNDTKLQLLKGHVQSKAEWYNDVISAALDDVIEAAGGPAWTEAEFAHLVTQANEELPDLLAGAADALGGVLVLLGEIAAKLDHLDSTTYTVSVDD